MRVVAGKLGGRQFEAPAGHRTHPMSEKARGALFNALGDIEGLTILDAFAGSGALSFEALSRGAANALAVEMDKKAHSQILKNIRMLQIEDSKIKAVRANSSGWSDNNPNAEFDLVFAAPPYDDLQLKLLQKLTRHVKNSGVYVLDWPGNLTAPEFVGLKQIHQKKYGDAQLVFYRKTSVK